MRREYRDCDGWFDGYVEKKIVGMKEIWRKDADM